MRLVALLAGFEHNSIQPVFSGGTSLSKGYGLIRRFSEDLDFKLIQPGGEVPKPSRREYRQGLIDAIRGAGAWTIDEDQIVSRNGRRFFRIPVRYENVFSPTEAMRPYVLLEATFAPPALATEDRSLMSFIAQARNEAPEVPEIACVSPVETAADKLSALAWRVLTRKRGDPDDDPTLVRHLHDLSALERLAAEHNEFAELLGSLLAQDATTRARSQPSVAELEPSELLEKVFGELESDEEYPTEYDQFVNGMSYAEEGQTPSFAEALASARRLGGLLSA